VLNLYLLDFLTTYPTVTFFRFSANADVVSFWRLKRWQCFWIALKCQRKSNLFGLSDNYGWVIILTLVFILHFNAIWKKHERWSCHTTTSNIRQKGMGSGMWLLDWLILVITADLISLIPFWASNGYLTIENRWGRFWVAKDDTRLTIERNWTDSLPYINAQLFRWLFASHKLKC